ncbi:hypothetical protein DMN91_001405 [Ooceraea biroi]|uniref:Osiris n=1 Tax=Ooceraea biroi TaxID=2015173 RepID=A0A026W528_OOCBI|nr:uncharacterized protein LOC105283455 [Ooceraea biroi]EZA50726.1 hypothetical protein X777_10776 [Ooceraea biroi]RLU27601.1 hypothetical protein DMN91_001405 [Ooceraea biroi]
MKAIGRTLACVLLAVALVKNVLATSAANIEFSKGRSNKTLRSNITRLNLVSEQPLPSLDNEDLRSTPKDMFEGEDKPVIDLKESRTFGQKRIQFMLMPMMYKMGVMMTMLMVLTAISVKGLVIGIILLVLKLSTFLGTLHSGWHAPQPWSSSQPIHVHVHNSYPHAQAYHSWESSGPGYDDHYYYKG